jgi:uncharacterized protein
VSLAVSASASAAAPSFGCRKAKPASIEGVICHSSLLSALDRETERLYRLTQPRGVDRTRARQRANEQKAFVAERNSCISAPAVDLCTRDRYLARIAWLRISSKAARSADARGISLGPFAYRCDDSEFPLRVTFVNADPGLLYLQQSTTAKTLEQRLSGSGARYESDGDLFWEHQGEALWRNGVNAPELRCTRDPIG